MTDQNRTQLRVNIVGAGMAGLSAAITLAKEKIPCNLISLQQSERAQSVLAEGGINGALDTMGEGDEVQNHFADTMRAGCDIADPVAVEGLTQNAPQIITMLHEIGVPFNEKNGAVVLRNFGGQKLKRTAYAKSSTGKVIMTALIDEARKYERKGLIRRFPHHELLDLNIFNKKNLPEGAYQKVTIKEELLRKEVKQGKSYKGQDYEYKCVGAMIRDTYTDDIILLEGPVILACGGLNGVFPEMTTGTTANSGAAAALAFSKGVIFSNLEMIQYHPTTIGIAGKRCLVTEAARGEGGRLFVYRGKEKWYFMEEKYPEYGNLMPRDVVAREMYQVVRSRECGDQVYLDMTGLPEEVWKKRLPDLRNEILHYLSLDPKKEYIPVEPGIHYFMGGIDVDAAHRTNVEDLYAAGECCSQYHGANRLGGNSMLGAIYGGRTAAETLTEWFRLGDLQTDDLAERILLERQEVLTFDKLPEETYEMIYAIRDVLSSCMGIVRSEQEMRKGLLELEKLSLRKDAGLIGNARRLDLAQAMILSALERQESRGAHYRTDYPERSDDFCGPMLTWLEDGQLRTEIKINRQ